METSTWATRAALCLLPPTHRSQPPASLLQPSPTKVTLTKSTLGKVLDEALHGEEKALDTHQAPKVQMPDWRNKTLAAVPEGVS